MQFSAFERQYNRQYATFGERMHRRGLFRANLARIERFNQLERGSAEYGVTQFADMSAAEFDQWKGLRPRSESAELWRENDVRHVPATIPEVALPREFDWREKGVVSEVKNQGQCGSCWAFSVTGNIEGLHAIKTGKLESYSEQELVDCDKEDNGCNGGLPDNAYKWVVVEGEYYVVIVRPVLFSIQTNHTLVFSLACFAKGHRGAGRP